MSAKKKEKKNSFERTVLDSNHGPITKVFRGVGYLAGTLVSAPLMIPCSIIEIARGKGDQDPLDDGSLNMRVIELLGEMGAEIAGFVPGAIVGTFVGNELNDA
jgi:hypothetical protein